MKPVYLDYNATTPVHPEVAAAMRPYLEGAFGNPSSAHPYGVRTRQAVERARQQVAELLGCDPGEVIFTSGGSEANNLALQGVARRHRHGPRRRIVISAVEHPAVAEVCRYLAEDGFVIGVAPVDGTGRVDPAELARMLGPDVLLVSVMHAQNEVGTIQPIAEIAAAARACGALVHCDAAQSVGKIPVRVDELGVDLLSLAGHKLYAPQGVGALYLRSGVELARLLHGASHEQGRRAGTENVAGVVGLGAACALAHRDQLEEGVRQRRLRERLHAALGLGLPGGVLQLHGHPELRLPNTLNLGFFGIDAATLLAELQDEVSASAGAACHAGEPASVSGVLRAMAVPFEAARGAVRFSLGRMTTEQEVDRAAAAILRVAAGLLPAAAELAAGGGAALPPAGEVKLTRFSHGLGCGCKLRPQDLERALAELVALPGPRPAAVLVGPENSDDAAVWRLNDEQALVQTVDFFTPVVDDPYRFGQVAAANALSDIYAMGAQPLFALNVVAFPAARLPLEVLQRMLRGARDKAAEAGIPILGGHTVDDPEPKLGLAVTGLVHPDRVLTNAGALPGQALVLTKAIGNGIVATAAKRGAADPADVELAVAGMATLNDVAAALLHAHGATACTDVTGFGLLGHLREMTRASAVDARLHAGAIPLHPAARALARAGHVPGAARSNLEHVSPHLVWAAPLGEMDRLLLADPQTSGGLLVALPALQAALFVARLREQGVDRACIIGELTTPGPGRIVVEL